MDSTREWLFSKTRLAGVYQITPSTYKDFRGRYVEIYNSKFIEKNLNKINFIQDCISESKNNVLRGIHGDFRTWKLISCLSGSFYLIVVNNIKNSKEYRKWISFRLSHKNRKQILVPPGYGNGHLVTSKSCVFHYKQSTYYNRKSQFTIKWNDKNYTFRWPLKRKPIISKRDK
jgi:dTDP-4-dehydrorhamnose 3,5-epimerase